MHGRVICPYHSWSYPSTATSGRRRDSRTLDGFDPADHGLVGSRATEWHGLVFVDASGTATAAGGSAGRDSRSWSRPTNPNACGRPGRHDYVVAANWKILTENYQECYHCPMIHPELCEVSPPKSGDNYTRRGTMGGWDGWTCARAWTPCRSTARAVG